MPVSASRSPRLVIQPLCQLLLAAFPLTVLAQQAPDAGQLLQEQRRSGSGLPDRLPGVETEPAVRPALSETGGARITLKTIRFSGIEGLASEAELQALLADALGRALDYGQLQQLAERVTLHLKSKGWFLARAYLPQQDVTDGTLEIAVVRGRIEGGADGQGLRMETKLTRLNPKRVRETVKRALFADGDDGVHALKLERALLLLNDLPGTSARATVEKGDTPGSTRVAVEVEEGPQVSGVVAADNYGNRYTGSERLTGQLAFNNPLGEGDQLTVNAVTARNLNLGSLGYSIPIGYNGLRASVNYTSLSYRIGEELASNESRGTAQTTSMMLGYPFIRQRDLNLRGQAGFEYKNLRDETLGQVQKDRRIRNFVAGLSGDSYDQLGGGGLSNFSLLATHGDADLSRVASDVTGDASARTAGSFSKLNYGVARLQKLTDRYSLYATLSGQIASRNLVSSEKFILGGPNGVRAYPSSEGSGDEGSLATVEVRYDLAERVAMGNVQLIGFVDAGYVTLNKSPWSGSAGNASNSNRYGLAGTGLGLNYTRLGMYSIRAMWATKLGSNPGRASVTNYDADGKGDNSRFWLQALVWF